MQELSLEEMLDCGAHFGHQTRRWNPKMRPYIYGARSGIHILDLEQTLNLFQKAMQAVRSAVAGGQEILFVGTKEQAQLVIEEEAKRCSMPFVTRRWLGGLLTNFSTISKSVDRFIELETRRAKNDFAGYTKKELLQIDREIGKFQITLGGIKAMKKLPGVLFVVDPHIEHIAIHEANVLNIPIIAVADTNADPDPIDYLIPANDDSMRSIRLFTTRIADAAAEGMQQRELLARMEDGGKGRKGREGDLMTKKAYVSKAEAFDGETKLDTFSASVEEVEEVSDVKEDATKNAL